MFSKDLSAGLADVYKRMEKAYDEVAGPLDFSCEGCSDNCCDSYFLHHTYVEWAYLWEGFGALAEACREEIIDRASAYVVESEKRFATGERPRIMCPLNENGRCVLYDHRMMICRMHGVPSSVVFPTGEKKEFPGCFRCQDLVGDRTDTPAVDRTALYRELAELEKRLLRQSRAMQPKVKKSIAQMLVQGPPVL